MIEPAQLTVGYLTSSLSGDDGWGRYSKALIEGVSRYASVRILTQANVSRSSALPQIIAALPPASFSLKDQWKVFRLILRHFRGCNVVHSLVEPYAPAAALAARFLGARLVMTLHGTYSVPPAGLSVQGLLMRFALRTACITTTGSRYTEMKTRRRVRFGECRFIPNGVDDSVFKRIPNAAKEDMIMTTGWLKARKGMDIMIRAFGMLKDRYPLLKCVIVGQKDNESYFQRLLQLAQQTGAPERIQFAGRVDDAELVRLYNTAKVFVFPARDIHENFEGFPMVFYEANACGTPVVTTRGFGSEYVIVEGSNGFLVESDDVDGTAAAISRLLDDRALYENMVERSIQITGEHTWDKIAPRIVQLYRDGLSYV